uniref:Uncharacterized protein n=1 Tax=Macrostomum lignano TaxID=282301 RepID=A0A1I8H8L1_9PLAT
MAAASPTATLTGSL